MTDASPWYQPKPRRMCAHFYIKMYRGGVRDVTAGTAGWCQCVVTDTRLWCQLTPVHQFHIKMYRDGVCDVTARLSAGANSRVDNAAR